MMLGKSSAAPRPAVVAENSRPCRKKTNPAQGGVRTPILLVIPRLVWTLSGGQTPFGSRVTDATIRLMEFRGKDRDPFASFFV